MNIEQDKRAERIKRNLKRNYEKIFGIYEKQTRISDQYINRESLIEKVYFYASCDFNATNDELKEIKNVKLSYTQKHGTEITSTFLICIRINIDLYRRREVCKNKKGVELIKKFIEKYNSYFGFYNWNFEIKENDDRQTTQKEKEQHKTIENDSVNHPAHYTQHPSGVECIQITQYYDFCVGNAIKYLWRAGLKREQGMDDRQKQIEDLKKAVWYINKEIENL